MSPAHTPHVLLQKILEPGEKAQVDIDIAPGAYDLHTLEPGGVVTVDYEDGDGTMALFGAPSGNSTHPTDAVLVGLALQSEVRDHIPLNMRIGINYRHYRYGTARPAK